MSLAKLFYLKETFRESIRRWRHSCFRRRAQPSTLRTQHFLVELLEPRVLLSATPTEVVVSQQLGPAAITVPAGSLPSLDVDLNGQADALSDGIVIIRHLFGFTGNALVDGVVDPNGQRTDPTAIQNYLNSISSSLDVDLNQNADALSDGIVIIRSLFGFTGQDLTAGVVDPAGQRTDPTVIAAFLDSMNPAREQAAPLLTADLQQDTGVSASDGITFIPTITGSIADLNPIAGFSASIESGSTAPSIRLVGLNNGAIVSLGVMIVEFSAENFTLGDQGETHLNFYVDNDPTPYRFFNGSTQEVLYNGVHTHFVHWHDVSSIEFHGLASGNHQIRFALVNAADQELADPSASLVLNFPVAQAQTGEFTLEALVAQANFPTAMAFAPDGRLFYTELQTGAIRVVDQAGQLQPIPWARLTVKTGGEEGLLGIAIDPNFSTNGFVYVYHTISGPQRNRIVRLQDIQGVGTNLTVIMDNLPGATNHNGGKLTFGPDGKLYAWVGDTQLSSLAQDPTFLGGKILRINTDGSIPDDNPFANSPVYSLGHRNGFGITFHPHTGDLWQTENGPTDNDEINRIVAGKNYGWPIVSGVGNNPLFINPLLTFSPPIAPTGIAAASENSVYPEQYHNNLFFGDYNTGKIRRIVLTGADLTQIGSVSVAWAGGLGGVLDIVEGPDGYLYASTVSQISRVKLASPNVGQITNVAAANQVNGTVLVTWTTGQPSDAQVEYGLTTAYGLLTPVVQTSTTSHAVTVSNLQPDTTYHYRVRSTINGSLLVSEDFTFTTAAVPVVPSAMVDVLASLQSNGTFTFNRTRLEQIFGGPLADGRYVLHLQATDSRGNVSGLQDVSFTLDTTPPAVPNFDLDAAFDTLPLGDHQTTFDIVTLKGQTDANISVALSQSSVLTQSDHVGMFTLSGVSLVVGSNPFTVQATDLAGNQRGASQTIIRSASAPAMEALITTSARVNMLQPAKDIHRSAAWESGEEGHRREERDFASAFAQRCWVKEFIAGTVVAAGQDEEELLITLS